MLALRVPCDAQSSRRDVKLGLRPQTTHPEFPGSICASRRPERDFKINIKSNIVGAPSRRDSLPKTIAPGRCSYRARSFDQKGEWKVKIGGLNWQLSNHSRQSVVTTFPTEYVTIYWYGEQHLKGMFLYFTEPIFT